VYPLLGEGFAVNHASPASALPHPGLARLPGTIVPGQPPTALAPMQDVTDLAFMTVIGEIGPPDWFVTEFFRVTPTSRLEPHIVRSITENPTGRPVFAQVIGEDLAALARAARDLARLPIAGLDLNLGCPAPKIYRKNVGGGLLRDLPHVDRILGTLRETVGSGLFTVKTRIGFADTDNFDALLDLVVKHRVDLLGLHARTVKASTVRPCVTT
jgi:tRNA-dihydrouridine synthase